jgi:hypothetical protein
MHVGKPENFFTHMHEEELGQNYVIKAYGHYDLQLATCPVAANHD